MKKDFCGENQGKRDRTSFRNPSPTILEAEDIRASYDGSEVLHGISILLKKGEFVGIAGPNGSGKSTLLKVMSGLKAPSAGRVSLMGKPLLQYPRKELARKIAVIFQDFSCPYEFSVFDIVAMGRSPYLSRLKPLSIEDRAIINEAMEMTDVAWLKDRLFFELSGGERQRVIIAKALAQKPSILLLDEPAAHLDIRHQVNVFEILKRLNRQNNVTIVCVTHDLTLGSQYIERLVLLNEGKVLADGPPKKIIKQKTMEHLFQIPVFIGLFPESQKPFIFPVIK